MGSRGLTIRMWALAACLWGTMPAQAQLGGSVSDVDALAARLQASDHTSWFSDYSVRTLEAGGVSVREYLDAQGTVFAVAWNTVAPPDLAMLLGGYFPRYSAQVTSIGQPAQQRSLRVADSGLIVETSGHLRAYLGRAWLVAGLPATVSVADIR